MSQHSPEQIRIPDPLIETLVGFRRALLRQRLRDGLAWLFLLFATVLLVTLVADRFTDTPRWIRYVFDATVVAVLVWVLGRQFTLSRRSRRPLQIAGQIRRQQPDFGDDLVGALELVQDPTELARSSQLCRAALEQIAERSRQFECTEALPPSSGRRAIAAGSALLLVLLIAGAASPAMLGSALDRLTRPWGDIPRFTFVSMEACPDRLVVPRDEPARWRIGVKAESRWVPETATLWVGTRRLTARCDSDREFEFDLPNLIEPCSATLKIGDAAATFEVVPKQRPHLVSVTAEVTLPGYLQDHPRYRETRNVVGDEISILQGSDLTVTCQASAELRSASLNGQAQQPQALELEGRTVRFHVPSDQERLQLSFIDQDALSVEQPVTLMITRAADRGPSLRSSSEAIPPRVLDSQALSFQVQAQDDYRVRRVGMQWKSGDDSGDRVIGPVGDSVTMQAVFQATALRAPVGELQVRFWAEDDNPDNARVYSDPVALNVLTADEHAVWIAGEFAKWRLAAMDVRDRELSLFQQNRELAGTDSEARDEQWRAAVSRQAQAEQMNAKQLNALTNEGKALMQQAARNDQVDANYVEQLAGTLETLQNLSEQRMPAVAELLQQAAEEESKFAAMQDQESTQGVLEAGEPGQKDAKDSQAENADGEAGNRERVGLAQTTIVDTSKRKKKEDDAGDDEETDEALSLAIDDQTELVAEFDAVAEQLRSLLGNMEGSTLVKRLKSVSRLQDRVATRLGRNVEDTFGQSADENASTVQSAAVDISETAKRVRTVLDDLEALCERRDIEHFASVLKEMKEFRVLDGLKQMEGNVAARPAVSIAIAEYWSDNLDRWADDLIDPRTGNSNEKSGPKKSLSPAVVLEVLRILESEVGLREQTRVAEQGRAVMERDDYMGEAIRLSEAQDLLRDRLDIVVEGLEADPEGVLNFTAEIEVLSAASAAMVDATKTLVSPETGAPAIAAQTEVIELLLQSNKVSPDTSEGGGGGSGASAGGEADQAAVAMLGQSLNELAQSRGLDTEVASSNARDDVPERFREGVVEYFDRLEKRLSNKDGGGP